MSRYGYGKLIIMSLLAECLVANNVFLRDYLRLNQSKFDRQIIDAYQGSGNTELPKIIYNIE